MDRTSRLLDELKMAEARSESAESWSEPARRGRREVRRLRAAWQQERTMRSIRASADEHAEESDAS